MLEIKNVTKTFGGLKALDDISLIAEKQEIRFIIGPNGAGKTTLFNIISGILPSSHGSVKLEGTELTGLNVSERALCGVGRTMQVTSLFNNFTVIENLTLAVQAKKSSYSIWWLADRKKGLHDETWAVLKKLGLDRIASKFVWELPHGDMRIVEIAIALAGNPKLILLDEPFSGMSLGEAKRMIEVIRSLKNEVTVLAIEHDMGVVMDLADRITVLDKGQVVAEGSPDEIRSNNQVKVLYLGE